MVSYQNYYELPKWYERAIAELEADLDRGDIDFEEFKEALRELDAELEENR